MVEFDEANDVATATAAIAVEQVFVGVNEKAGLMVGVVAHGPVGLPADDPGHLRDTGGIFVGRVPQSARTLEPHLVHGVVQRCARRNHGNTVVGELRAHGTPLGRRPSAICRSGRPCASDATRYSSKASLSKGPRNPEPGKWIVPG